MSLEKFRKFLLNNAKSGLIAGGGIWILFFAVGACFANPEANNLQPAEGLRASPALVKLLDVLLLVGILICFFISVKVKSFLRDGELASGWSLFSISFIFLFAAQLLSFLVDVSLTNVSHSIISAVRLLFILSLASGIYFMKKVLS